MDHCRPSQEPPPSHASGVIQVLSEGREEIVESILDIRSPHVRFLEE